jgi:hypothetical protein
MTPTIAPANDMAPTPHSVWKPYPFGPDQDDIKPTGPTLKLIERTPANDAAIAMLPNRATPPKKTITEPRRPHRQTSMTLALIPSVPSHSQMAFARELA